MQIGGEVDESLSNWFKKSEHYYSEEESEQAEKQDDLFEKLIFKGNEFSSEFIELVIKISNELHEKGVIKKVFGKSIPIIIHELEYYDEPIKWTIKGNPKGIVQEFVDWVKNM